MQWTPDKIQRRTITVDSSLGPSCWGILCPRYVHNLQRIHHAFGEARVISSRAGSSAHDGGTSGRRDSGEGSTDQNPEWQHAEDAFDAGNGDDVVLASYRCQVTRVGHCRMEPAKAGSRKLSQLVEVYEIYFDKELRWVHQNLLLFTEHQTRTCDGTSARATPSLPQPNLVPSSGIARPMPIVAPVPFVPVPAYCFTGSSSTPGSSVHVMQCASGTATPRNKEDGRQLATSTTRCASSEPRETATSVSMLSLPLSTASSPTPSPSQLFPPVLFARQSTGSVMAIPSLQLPATRSREEMPPPAQPPARISRDESGKPHGTSPKHKRQRSHDQGREQEQEQAHQSPAQHPAPSMRLDKQNNWEQFPVFVEPVAGEHSKEDMQVLSRERLEAAVRVGYIVATCAEKGCGVEEKELISQSPLLVLYLHELFPQCHRDVLRSLGTAIHAGPTQFAAFIQKHLEDHFKLETVKLLNHCVSFGVLVHSLMAQWKVRIQSPASPDAEKMNKFRSTVALFGQNFAALAPFVQPQWIPPIRQFLSQWHSCFTEGTTLTTVQTPFVCTTLIFRRDLVPSCTQVAQPQETKTTGESS